MASTALQPIELVETPTELVLHRSGSAFSWYSFTVVAENKLQVSKTDAGAAAGSGKRINIDAVYGVFQLLRGYYLAVVTKSTPIAVGPYGAQIYQVDDMEWFHVPAQQTAGVMPLTAEESAEEATYMDLLRQISETKSFYFAAGYDLTNSLQRNDAFVSDTAAASDGIIVNAASLRPKVGSVVQTANDSWKFADDRFFWNRAGVAELITIGASDLITPFINGFVDSRATTVDGVPLTLMLISRRGCTRQGTRFNMRGADSDGNVANYAETEQLLLFKDGQVSSYMQIRGSIPLLWEQPVSMKYTPKAKLASNTAASFAALTKHVAAQLTRYGRMTAINLIDKKKDQFVLGDAFRKDMEQLNNPLAKYVWFDFHHECRKMQWQNLSKLLDEVAANLEADGYYAKDARGTVNKVQQGIFRTNCMDNLDRTNVVQSLFARRAALSAVPSALEKVKASRSSVLTSPFPDFEDAFNNMWANNADAVSFLYSGTGALKTDFTRTGRRTLMGSVNDGINSVMRYVLNNLSDGRTQDAWDLFLGRYIPKRHHHHRRHHSKKQLTDGAVAAPTEIVTPLKAHLSGTTPVSFFIQSLLVFSGLTTLVALSFTPPSKPLWARLSMGAGVASVILAGLAYMLLSKGIGFGRYLVSKPQFVPHTHSARQSVADAAVVPPATAETAADSTVTDRVKRD